MVIDQAARRCADCRADAAHRRRGNRLLLALFLLPALAAWNAVASSSDGIPVNGRELLTVVLVAAWLYTFAQFHQVAENPRPRHGHVYAIDVADPERPTRQEIMRGTYMGSTPAPTSSVKGDGRRVPPAAITRTLRQARAVFRFLLVVTAAGITAVLVAAIAPLIG